METNTTYVVFLCVFLALTGAGGIVSALGRLGSKVESDSALETKLFKWSAPAGLVYGVVAILLVIGIIKFWSYPDKEPAVVAVDPNASVRIKLTSRESASAIGSRVVITYDKNAIGSSELRFQGVVGASSSSFGPFNETVRRVQRGDQFFVQLEDRSVWGVNVLAEQVDMIIEVFPAVTKQPDAQLSNKSLLPTAQSRAPAER
ncbi:hypothetical protein [Gilvimarinus japonicus]|uniref:Uncharacterized protein n=1 Tax=Gilvimarinus japonicus TaxID=1796469 RepID=A0ABV7HPM2_9GAMM